MSIREDRLLGHHLWDHDILEEKYMYCVEF